MGQPIYHLQLQLILTDSKYICSTISIALDYSTPLTVGCAMSVSRVVEVRGVVGCNLVVTTC